MLISFGFSLHRLSFLIIGLLIFPDSLLKEKLLLCSITFANITSLLINSVLFEKKKSVFLFLIQLLYFWVSL